MDLRPAADPASPAGPWCRLRLDLAYDGGPFRGFADNEGVRSVAGDLSAALRRTLGDARGLTGAGRTDAGVHAREQVVTVEVPSARLDPDRLVGSLNRQLAPTIAVRAVAVVDETFDARFSARSRTYRYRILNAPTPDPLLAPTVWHVREPLSVPAMRQAAIPLLGEHDFSAFCRRPAPQPDGTAASLVRRVLAARWLPPTGDLLEFEIEATAFCHQMVRSIVGTLVDVGRGRRRAGELLEVLASRDRSRAGSPAPPHGLVLWAVRYAEAPTRAGA
jgi:tRNA pseudouridine38-40 synthase